MTQNNEHLKQTFIIRTSKGLALVGGGGSLRNNTTMKADQKTSYFFEGRNATIFLVRGEKKRSFIRKKIQISQWFITAQNSLGPLSLDTLGGYR